MRLTGWRNPLRVHGQVRKLNFTLFFICAVIYYAVYFFMITKLSGPQMFNSNDARGTVYGLFLLIGLMPIVYAMYILRKWLFSERARPDDDLRL